MQKKELHDELDTREVPFLRKMLKLCLWDMKHENIYITLKMTLSPR